MKARTLVLSPGRAIWLRSNESAQIQAVDSTFVPPLWLSHEHAPRVEGNYLVINAQHNLSSHLAVVDLREPGRQLHILLQDTYYRDLHYRARVQWRIVGDCLYLCDSRGRLAGVDLNLGQLSFFHRLKLKLESGQAHKKRAPRRE